MPHKRDWKLRISDILECIENILAYTDGMTFEQFQAERMTIDAVCRNFEIIGEASRHIPPQITASHPHVPWDKMRAMRNIIAHVYFGVSLRIIWETRTTDLPPLVAPLKAILAAAT